MILNTSKRYLELEALNKILPMIKSRSLSLREGALWLTHETGRSISHQGLQKDSKQKMDKNDWDLNPQNYLQNEDGSFKLKADGTKKKPGRPKGSKAGDTTITQKLKQNKKLQKKVRAKKKKK